MFLICDFSWKNRLFVTPSRLVLLTGAALLGTCAVIAAVVGILHWRERVSVLLLHFSGLVWGGGNFLDFFFFSFLVLFLKNCVHVANVKNVTEKTKDQIYFLIERKRF